MFSNDRLQTNFSKQLFNYYINRTLFEISEKSFKVLSVILKKSSIINKKGITQTELSKKIRKSPTELSQIINGVYEPILESLDKICEALEVSKAIVYFLTISEKDVPKNKVELFKMLAPSIKDFLVKVFGTEQQELINQRKTLFDA